MLKIFKKEEICPYCEEGIVRNRGWGICQKCIAFVELGERSFDELKTKEKNDAIKILKLTTPPFDDKELYRKARDNLLCWAESSIVIGLSKLEKERHKNEKELKEVFKTIKVN